MRLHPLFALAIPASCAAASTPAVPAGLVVPRAPIAGGKPAASGELSFMVAVEFRGEHVMCGGSLISPTAVLTLSTCVGNRGIANIQVRAGAHAFKGNGYTLQGGLSANVIRVERHPNGVAAILVLDRAITESSTQKIGYAELVPDDYDPEAGNRAYAFGWGFTHDDRTGNAHKQTLPKHLMKASFVIISRTQCADIIRSRMGADLICIRPKYIDSAICRGDTGGPFVDSKNRLIGISYLASEPCPVPMTLVSFVGVRVSALMAWIRRLVKDLPPPPPAAAGKPGLVESMLPSRRKGKGYVRLPETDRE